ncbi:MAG: sugar transferase [Ruminococcaceae bacterium]|nr:sugar transferase [Oscillospiraceae bacterium]
MKRTKLDGVKHAIRTIEGSLEVAVLTVAYYLVWRIGYDAGTFPAYFGYGKIVLAGVYALLTLVLFRNFDGFEFGYMKLFDVIISQWIAMALANFITYWQLCLIANAVVSPAPILLLTVIDAVIIFVCVYLFTVIYHHLYVPKNMVMIYGTESALTLKFKMDTRKDKYRITKLIDISEGFDAICKVIVNYDAVIINDVHAEIRNDILKFCYKNGIRTYVSPKITDIIVRGATRISLFDTPLLLVRSKGLTLSQRAVKRIFDVVLSAIAMIVAAPIMLITAIAIKIEDGGPVFYKQERVTIHGKVFQILKFRSMIVDAEKDGKSHPATDRDPRITRVGSFIRATRIDELPQILNILKGDMSIVGPRPERVEHMQEYGKDIPEFAFRLKVKGGLTGYAQIYGKYNTSPYDKLRLDMNYIENYSLMLDIKLVLTTLRILLSKESTEGFDKLEELERMKQEILKEQAEAVSEEV